MPSHFHSAMKSAAFRLANWSLRSHAPASPAGTASDRDCRACRRARPATRTDRDRAARAPATSIRVRADPSPPSAAAAVLANRAEIPIRIAPVTSFSSAQRPVSSSSSSQRVSCFGSSVLPSVRSVVTTSVRVGGGGLLWPGAVRPLLPRAKRVVGRGRAGVYQRIRLPASLRKHPPPPTPPHHAQERAGGGGKSATSAPPSPRDRRRNHTTARTAPDRCGP